MFRLRARLIPFRSVGSVRCRLSLPLTLNGPTPCLIEPVLVAKMRKHGSGALLVDCQQGHQDFSSYLLALVHLARPV